MHYIIMSDWEVQYTRVALKLLTEGNEDAWWISFVNQALDTLNAHEVVYECQND